MIERVGAALGAVAVAIFVFGVVMTGDARQAEADDSAESLDIDVILGQLMALALSTRTRARRSPTVFSYNELVVPVDTTINLSIDSTDVIHRWFIPALGGQVEAVPGEIVGTSFRADEEGLYEGQSTQFSGTSFPAMRAWVQEEYEQYVADLGENLCGGPAGGR